MMAASAETIKDGMNGVLSSPERDKEVNSDEEEEVRRRTTSSISRTKTVMQAAAMGPAATDAIKIKMDDIKQKIDFTESAIDKNCGSLSPSPPPSSRIVEEDEEPVKLTSPPLMNNSRNDKQETTVPLSIGGMDGEQKTSVEDILDRLETVRNYTTDARSLYEQLQAHEHEPGTAEQMERVSMLIGQLKQQELSYLQVLLKIMEDQNIDEGQLGQLEQMMNRTVAINGGEYDDEEQEEYEEDEDEEEEEGEGSNDSMSLRAEIKKDSNNNDEEEDINSDEEVEEENESNSRALADELAEQQRELEALHEQRALLLRLQEQQSQLDVLRTKQAQLLQLKREAEERLSAAERQCDELGDTSHNDYSQDTEGLLVEETTEENNQASEREKQLLAELEELKVKKNQAEKLMGELSTLKATPVPPKPVEVAESRNELVDTNLQELQSRMRQIEDARHKMKELQEMVGMLQGMTLTKQTPAINSNVPQTQTSGHKKPRPPPTNDSSESQDDEVIGLLADYERNIGNRQRELESIKKRKEELKQVEKMLQELQLFTTATQRRASNGVNYDDELDEDDDNGEVQSEEEVEVGHRLASELVKQQELYADLRKKTQQLKQLQQEIEKFSRGSDHESAIADTTIATWGGSSVASMLSTAQEEEPREGTENTDPNLPQYHVDRHTPRHPRPLRRAYSPHDDQDTTTGKKIKLEPQSSGSLDRLSSSRKNGPVGQSQQQHQTPSVNKRSAVWPSVIFSQSANANKTTAGKVQTPPSFSCPKVHTPGPTTSVHSSILSSAVPGGTATAVPPATTTTVPSDYTLLLQQQLANSSAMCFQLMEHQASLLQALNQKLDTLPHIHEQMIQLHEYHEHLQGYHEYLNGAYWQIMDYSKEPGEQGPASNRKSNTNNGEEQPIEVEEDDDIELPTCGAMADQSPAKKTFPSGGIIPPPPLHSFNMQAVINSPYVRPTNPHLQASPDTKRLRPLSRPGYPYALYGSPNHLHPHGLVTVQNQETQCEGLGVELSAAGATAMTANPLEVESTSSLPDRSLLSNVNSTSPRGVTVFDKLRDTIYSEVATLIASNEDRPHFLVELFRELQLLNTDYLRQRALYSIQDLVTRFLKLEDALEPTNQESNEEECVNNLEEQNAAVASVPTARKGQRYDYTELVESASSVSTPPITEDPFASDTLGDTVIKMKNTEASSDFELDTDVLDEEIKTIMTNVIPVLKSHLGEECSPTLLSTIKSAIIEQVLSNDGDIKVDGDLGAVFSEQLQASLSTVVEKYQGKILKDCGEDLLVDVSEVLFNEVAFYRLIKETQGMSGKDYYQSVTSGSQTTTDLESITNSPQRPVVSSLALQSLGTVISKTLLEESESLGNNRDDELAKSWEPNETVVQTDLKEIESHSQKTQPSNDGGGEEEKGSDEIVENGYVNVTGTSPPSLEIITPPSENTQKESAQTTQVTT